MRWFVVPAVWLQACCVPLPFPHDHDDHTTDTISVDDDGGPPRDTALPPGNDTSATVDCPDGLYGGHTIVMAGEVDPRAIKPKWMLRVPQHRGRHI